MSQQTAIITGAGGAIAQHVIDAFEAAGWSLALVAYDEAELARLQESRSKHVAVQGNLADDAEARRAIGEAVTALGHVDALLNIAGGFDMAGAVDTTPEQLEAQFDINLRTAFNATRAVLPSMLSRGHGFVLGVGAAAAIDGGASVGAYAASKGALVAWLKSVGAELRAHGIAVSVMHPMAAVDTAGNRAAMPDVDPKTWIDPAELAATALHLATRGPRGYVPEARVYPPA